MNAANLAVEPTNTSLLDTLQLSLQMADNALILSHRLGEWCGHGPVLEQDIALTNIALDHLGRARSLYQYIAALFATLPRLEQEAFFKSPLLSKKIMEGIALAEDDFAFLRDAWDFKNALLVEQPNGDFAQTVLRSFFMDVYHYYFFNAMRSHSNETWAAIAEKSLKEVTYHLRWSSEWVIRMGDGTEESHLRAQTAIDTLWMYTGEVYNADNTLRNLGLEAQQVEIANACMEKIKAIFEEATLSVPENAWMQQGGKVGIHSEHLGFMLAEMQYMQRTYPGMEW